MAKILTTHGMLDEETLVKSEGSVDNENEHTTWEEWRLGDEVVKRNAHVRLKKPAAFADGAIGEF